MKTKPHLEALYRVTPQQGRGDFLRLDMNENPEGLPEAFVREVLCGITPDSIALYPEKGALTEELAAFLDVSPECIVFGNGSDELIKTVFEGFGGAGSNIVSVYPTFEMYAVYANMFDMEHRRLEFDDSWSVSAEALAALIDENTAIVSVLNPNNPIGVVFSEAELRMIIRRADEAGAVVIIDEAYHYFHEKSFIELTADCGNVILLRTFSKLCSLAGLRAGFAVAQPGLAGYLRKLKSSYDLNCVAIAFVRALIKDSDMIYRLMRIEREGREYIISKLEASGREYFAKNGNYVFIKCPAGITPEEIAGRFYDEGVLVKTYGVPIFKDYFRITTGSRAVMSRFWEIYERVLA
jgi:histidinol-phosphate aminotransferase